MTSTLSPVPVLGHRCEVLHASFGAERFDRHIHDVFSIGLVTRGANAFGYRGREALAPTGSVCVADPGEVHDGGLTGRPWSYANLFVPPEVIEGLRAEEGAITRSATIRPVVREPGVAACAAAFFEAAREACETGGMSDDGLLDEAALRLLERLFAVAGATPHPRPAPDDVVATRAIAQLHDARGVGVTLDDLAREAGASRYRVVRSVRRSLGVTPMAHALHLRVAEAKRLILAGEPIAEAAAATGFADRAHLTRRMRRLLGVTPGRLAPCNDVQEVRSGLR